MAFSHGTASRIWINGFPASCELNEITLEAEIEPAETTTFCETAKAYIPGLEDGTAEMAGFFKSDAANPTDQFEFLLDSLKRTTFPTTFSPEGGGQLGDPAYMLNGFLTTYTVETNVEDAALIELEFQTNNGIQRGLVAKADANETTSGDTDPGIDNAVSSSDGGSAILSVAAASGTSPTLDVVIEHTADDPAGTPVWTTLATFTQATDQTAERLTFSGTVERYTRVVWTLGGTDPEFTFNVAVRRN